LFFSQFFSSDKGTLNVSMPLTELLTFFSLSSLKKESLSQMSHTFIINKKLERKELNLLKTFPLKVNSLIELN